MNYIQPRNDYILVERQDPPQKGRIIRPDIAIEKGFKGKVLAVGPGKWIEGISGNLVQRPLEVKVGDLIYFNSVWNDLAGDHYKTSSYEEAATGAERNNLHLVQEADVFGIIHPQDPKLMAIHEGKGVAHA